MQMSVILVLGAIAAIIYYVIQMRNAKRAEEEEEKKKEDYMDDMFIYPDEDHNDDKLLKSDPYDDLERLASLYEKGILTKEEYDSKKKELLDRI